MKKHCLLGSRTPNNEQKLNVSGEHTCHVALLVEEAWPQPGLCRASWQVAGRGQWCRVRLVWQTGKQGHSSLRPPQVFIKVRSRTHPLACTTDIRKNEGLETYHQHRGNNFWWQMGQERVLKQRVACNGLFSTRHIHHALVPRVFTHLKGTLFDPHRPRR